MTSICNYYIYMWTVTNPLKDKSREIRDNILFLLKQCCYCMCTFLKSSETKGKRKDWNLTTCREINQSESLILWSWVEYKIFPREDNLISTGTVRTDCSLSVVRSTVAVQRTGGNTWQRMHLCCWTMSPKSPCVLHYPPQSTASLPINHTHKEQDIRTAP